MRILYIVAALFVLAGCETLDHTSVTVSNGYSHHYPSNYIRFSLGFYSGHHYNSYSVYGDHGHRYYYAPRGYSGHRHYTRPHHYVQPTHHYVQPRHHYVQPRHQTRNDTHRRDATPPRRQPHRVTPPRRQPNHVVPQQRTEPQANNRRVERSDRVERGRRHKNQNQKRK